jgi:hypothetical protein
MEVIAKRFAYSTVQLKIHFMRGLYPFFPPTVEICRPHLW